MKKYKVTIIIKEIRTTPLLDKLHEKFASEVVKPWLDELEWDYIKNNWLT